MSELYMYMPAWVKKYTSFFVKDEQKHNERKGYCNKGCIYSTKTK